MDKAQRYGRDVLAEDREALREVADRLSVDLAAMPDPEAWARELAELDGDGPEAVAARIVAESMLAARSMSAAARMVRLMVAEAAADGLSLERVGALGALGALVVGAAELGELSDDGESRDLSSGLSEVDRAGLVDLAGELGGPVAVVAALLSIAEVVTDDGAPDKLALGLVGGARGDVRERGARRLGTSGQSRPMVASIGGDGVALEPMPEAGDGGELPGAGGIGGYL